MSSFRFDTIAIGSGLAGLAYALRASEWGAVCILTKAEARDANTSYAQGGIAAAVGESDSWELHERDTLTAGAGLCDPSAVRFLVQEAPKAISWLQKLGAHFTVSESGSLELGLEGGHSRNRIVHFEDRTGWEIERAVIHAVQQNPKITVLEHAFVTQLRVENGTCSGCQCLLPDQGLVDIFANSVMLATGGCGQLYQHTTNPRVATADGIALASAVGAEIRGMEFMQFHPTTLYHPQLRGFLITEACRGAGATLRNHLGRRFMYDYDGRLELAPRDIVARSIHLEMEKLKTWCVYLDLTHLNASSLKEEFPTIYERLASIGIWMEKDWIPVVPAQHYSCGGVVTSLSGETNIAGLYAAGEVAYTGVHGGNRLASNSLLEAMVFATSAADHARNEPGKADSPVELPKRHCIAEAAAIPLRRRIQRAMMESAGIIRSNAGMERGLGELAQVRRDWGQLPASTLAPYPMETENLLTAGEIVLQQAMARRTNVGLHYSTDLEPNPEQ